MKYDTCLFEFIGCNNSDICDSPFVFSRIKIGPMQYELRVIQKTSRKKESLTSQIVNDILFCREIS